MTADLTQRIGGLLGVPVTDVREAGAQHGYDHLTIALADGREAFAKAALGSGQATAFAAEANGLRWLGEAGAVPIPEVISAKQE